MKIRHVSGRIRTLFALSVALCLPAAAFALGAQQAPASAQSPPSKTAAPNAASAPGAPGAQLKTSTPEEKAAVAKFQQEPNPDEQIRQVEDFVLKYPNSAFKEMAFLTAAQAYESQANYGQAVTYGQLTVRENPNNVTALLVLATAISEMTGRTDSDRDERLTEGEQYAHHALDVIAAVQRPPAIAEADWNRGKQEAASAAHAALGLMALLREDFTHAELELDEAVALTTHPDAVLLYRLALSRAFLKKYDLALEALDRAEGLGGVKVSGSQGPQRDLIAEARAFVLRAQAGGAAPAADQQAPQGGATAQPPSAAPAPAGSPAPSPAPAPAPAGGPAPGAGQAP